jgi:acyl carrier protein
MSREEILNILKSKIASYTPLKEEDIHVHSNLKDELNLDSADVLEMVLLIEEEFGLYMPDDLFDSIQNVEDVIEYIEKNYQPQLTK